MNALLDKGENMPRERERERGRQANFLRFLYSPIPYEFTYSCYRLSRIWRVTVDKFWIDDRISWTL
jgi:hypothetical protein